jgi:hypothetical protein
MPSSLSAPYFLPSLALLVTLYAVAPVEAQDHFDFPLGTRSATQSDWDALNSSVDGRLFAGVPFARPCFESFNSSACEEVRNGYLDEGECIHIPVLVHN